MHSKSTIIKIASVNQGQEHLLEQNQLKKSKTMSTNDCLPNKCKKSGSSPYACSCSFKGIPYIYFGFVTVAQTRYNKEYVIFKIPTTGIVGILLVSTVMKGMHAECSSLCQSSIGLWKGRLLLLIKGTLAKKVITSFKQNTSE